MRTHGWGGRVPNNDEEAIARIIAAGRDLIDEKRSPATLADVARRLDVTRQTVYRYFANADELLSAIAMEMIDGFVDRVADRLRGHDEPSDAVVEGVLVVLDELPGDPYVSLLVAADRLSLATLGRLTSPSSLHLARSVIDRLDVDWDTHGFSDTDLTDLAEILLRTIASLILDQGGEHRTTEDLRRFLYRWVGPAVASMGGVPDPAAVASGSAVSR